MASSLLGESALGTVLIETCHGMPAALGHAGRITHGNEAVRVARITDHEDVDVVSGITLNRLPLPDEDLPIDAKEILALHSGLTRHASHKEGPVGSAEAMIQIRGRLNRIKQGECTIVELHDHTGQSLHSRLDLDQTESNWLVISKDLP